MSTRLYVSAHCEPCQAVKAAAQAGKLGNVEIVDIESDDGFAKFTQEVLSNGDGRVPSAYKEGAQCQILVNEETQDVIIQCPGDPEPAPAEASDSPPASDSE